MTWYILTHNDLDGAGAAILAAYATNRLGKPVIQAHNYESIEVAIKELLNNENIHKHQLDLQITDICPNEETCKFIDSNIGIDKPILLMRLYDHHKTRSWVKQYPWARFDDKECGTSLVAKDTILFDLKPSLEGFSKSIKAWDLWELSSPYRTRGEELNSIFGFLGFYKFVEVFMKDPEADLKDPLAFVIKNIFERRDRYIEQVLKDQLPTSKIYPDGLGHKFRVLFATDFISEIGNSALTHPDCEDLDYICIINPVSNSCSLRSRKEDNIDVSDIAKMLNGGGHKNAAGFPTKMTQMIEHHIFKLLNSLNY